mmetsp:Transcript_50438/g.119968  ORF Transcript_50438/g.119968 Transcript_50438/m.119968 type:complete len:206 (+) Transcript_50438:104-721(+)
MPVCEDSRFGGSSCTSGWPSRTSWTSSILCPSRFCFHCRAESWTHPTVNPVKNTATPIACWNRKGLGKRRKEKQTDTNFRQIPRPVATTAPKPWIAAVKAYVPPYARLTADTSHKTAVGSSDSRLLTSVNSPDAAETNVRKTAPMAFVMKKSSARGLCCLWSADSCKTPTIASERMATTMMNTDCIDVPRSASVTPNIPMARWEY